MSKTLHPKLNTIDRTQVCTEITTRRIVNLYLLLFLMFGLLLQPFPQLLNGMKHIFQTSGILITDYYVIGGVGAAIVNASLVALIGSGILMINGMAFTGLPIAAIFTMFGFALFGKNVLSITPLLIGSYSFARVTKQPFKNIACAALFATCLAPLGAHVAIEMGLGIPLGFTLNFVAGFLVPALSKRFATFHEGHNLYNIGFTAGITGMLIVSGLRLFGYNTTPVVIWGEDFDVIMRLFCGTTFLSMILIGWWLSAKRSYLSLLSETGVSPNDFVSQHGFGTTLINMGLMGLIAMLYIELAGSHYNGATVGGLFTIAGFAASGKHPKNCIPIMAGIYLGAILYPTTSPHAPGAMLAALFGTTLAPMAGRFGTLMGIAAGMIHLIIVTNVGILHGGVNLYNNGFSGGFVAIILITLIKSFQKAE